MLELAVWLVAAAEAFLRSKKCHQCLENQAR